MGWVARGGACPVPHQRRGVRTHLAAEPWPERNAYPAKPACSGGGLFREAHARHSREDERNWLRGSDSREHDIPLGIDGWWPVSTATRVRSRARRATALQNMPGNPLSASTNLEICAAIVFRRAVRQLPRAPAGLVSRRRPTRIRRASHLSAARGGRAQRVRGHCVRKWMPRPEPRSETQVRPRTRCS